MKFVPFRDDGETKSRAVFITALENAPAGSGGMNFADINRRSRVLAAIEKTTDKSKGVELEDADCNTLKDAFEALRINHAPLKAMQTFIAIRDDIANAKKPDKPAPAEKKK